MSLTEGNFGHIMIGAARIQWIRVVMRNVRNKSTN